MAKLKRHGGSTIPVGGKAKFEHNYPVIVVRIIPPYEEDDHGQVEIKFSWGETLMVDPSRIGAYIAD